MTTTRSGSAILFCLALATIAVMIGYAFLRTATRQVMSGKSEMLLALARDAAQSGLSHATEQILTDYNSSSLDIADATGTVTISPVPTFLDGPFRAPFVSFRKPGRLLYTLTSDSSYYDDVGEENHMLMPNFMKRDQYYSWWQEFDTRGVNGGNLIYDARGRFIEVNYHNTTRLKPPYIDPNPDPSDPTKPVPIATIRFTNMTAPKPERSDGLFLDENLHRLRGGTVEDQRRLARFRVRYAVGVEDLSGHFLSNPRANMNIDWKNPSNDYRTIPPWLEYSGYAWDNMMSLWSPSRATTLRLCHLFKGRGNANNADRAATAGPRQGLPATYPLMFRQKLNPGWDFRTWYGNFQYGGSPTPPNMGGTLYACPGDATWEPVTATVAGGNILTPAKQSNWAPYAHAQVGPIYSWASQAFAVAGVRVSNGRNDSNSEGYAMNNAGANLATLTTPFGRRLENNPTGGKWYHGKVDIPWQINLLTAPAQVVNEMLLAYIPPYLKWVHYYRLEYYPLINTTYSGPIDPKTGKGRDITYIFDTNEDLSKRQPINEDYQIPGLDLITDALNSNCFSEYPAPNSINPGDGMLIKPNYYQTFPYSQVDPASPPNRRAIPFEQRYPGPLARGRSVNFCYEDTGNGVLDPGEDSNSNGTLEPDEDRGNGVLDPGEDKNPDGTLQPNEDANANDKLDAGEDKGNGVLDWGGNDDMGKYINADSGYGGHGMDVGWDTHTFNPLVYQGGGDRSYWDKTPPTYNIIKRIDPKQFTFRYSYYYDLIRAMTTTISYVRATWVQYPTTVFDPRTIGAAKDGFDPISLRDPTAFDTIEEIDAMFLRQLGENYAAPGTRCPQNPIISKKLIIWATANENLRFSINPNPVSHIIRTLVGDVDFNNNGIMDAPSGHTKEDLNGDGTYSPGEDDNNNGVLDSGEDRNPDGQLDPGEDANGNGSLDGAEDANDNGLLDPGEDHNPDGVLQPAEDLDGDGVLDPGEDQGNGVLDADEDKGDGELNGLIDTGHGISAYERGKVMERMLNDFRMSFFGSSPKYRDFRPMDFDYDGKVMASCYPINPAATTNEVLFTTARWLPSDASGRGPAPADNMFFSVTGCFFIGKSHFYRIWTRGEVYDTLLKKPVSQQTLETVLTVDPEAPLYPAAGRVSAENRVLYKQWHYNDICSELPLQTK